MRLIRFLSPWCWQAVVSPAGRLSRISPDFLKLNKTGHVIAPAGTALLQLLTLGLCFGRGCPDSQGRINKRGRNLFWSLSPCGTTGQNPGGTCSHMCTGLLITTHSLGFTLNYHHPPLGTVAGVID